MSGSASKCTEPVYFVCLKVVYSLAGGSDYALNLDVFLIFDNLNHQQSFDVAIVNDLLLELDVEDFTLELRYDPFALEPPSNVILRPSVSTIEIVDDDSKS